VVVGPRSEVKTHDDVLIGFFRGGFAVDHAFASLDEQMVDHWNGRQRGHCLAELSGIESFARFRRDSAELCEPSGEAVWVDLPYGRDVALVLWAHQAANTGSLSRGPKWVVVTARLMSLPFMRWFTLRAGVSAWIPLDLLLYVSSGYCSASQVDLAD